MKCFLPMSFSVFMPSRPAPRARELRFEVGAKLRGRIEVRDIIFVLICHQLVGVDRDRSNELLARYTQDVIVAEGIHGRCSVKIGYCVRVNAAYGFSATTEFVRVPMPSPTTSTMSPSFKKRGGLCIKPTPDGDPSVMMSPGRKR